jgi:hypothetical protein
MRPAQSCHPREPKSGRRVPAPPSVPSGRRSSKDNVLPDQACARRRHSKGGRRARSHRSRARKHGIRSPRDPPWIAVIRKASVAGSSLEVPIGSFIELSKSSSNETHLISDTAAQTGGAAFLGSDPPRPARPSPEWRPEHLRHRPGDLDLASCSLDSPPTRRAVPATQRSSR